MQPSSFKTKIQKVLVKDGFKKSETTKGRVIDNISSGFTFTKMKDDYYLYFTSGNTLHRGMKTEEKDKKTMEMYNHLVSIGFGDNVELGSVMMQKAILLKPDGK